MAHSSRLLELRGYFLGLKSAKTAEVNQNQHWQSPAGDVCREISLDPSLQLTPKKRGECLASNPNPIVDANHGNSET